MRRQQVLEGEGGVARSELAELKGQYERMVSLCQTLQSKVCMCVVFVEVVVSRGVCAIKGCVCVAVVSTACA